MELIMHRRNKIGELQATDPKLGVEVDIRSAGELLIVHHEPFEKGELFEEWLKVFCHKTLILNVKEEGLEERLIKLMASMDIDDYFFLDQSFPFLVKWSEGCNKRCAVRVSEFESIETAMALAGKANWVWVDCFTRFPLNNKVAKQLQSAGFRLCLVSPELQGRDAEEEIPALSQLLVSEEISAEAVCTKRPDIWRALLD